MKKKDTKREIPEIKKTPQKHTVSGKTSKKNSDTLVLKKTIDAMLKEIPLKKVRRAKKLFKEWWCYEWLDEEQQLEQIYRAFYSSFKTRRSYWHFKTASVLLLYLYGYVSDKEIDAIKEEEVNMEKVFKKHRKEMEEVKEVDDTLRRKKFMGHIPTNVSCLAIGASIAFTRAVKSILDVVERLHKDDDYRKGLYPGRTVDWDEAILIKALPFDWMKKGGKLGEWEKLGNGKEKG